MSLKEAAIVMGIVLGYGAGAVFSDGNWRGVFECAIPFEVAMLLSSFFVIPESPRWLALRNRPLEAAYALQQAQVCTVRSLRSVLYCTVRTVLYVLYCTVRTVLYVRLCGSMRVYVYVCMFDHMYACLLGWLVSVCMCVCVSVYQCVCVCVYIYIYTYYQKQNKLFLFILENKI